MDEARSALQDVRVRRDEEPSNVGGGPCTVFDPPGDGPVLLPPPTAPAGVEEGPPRPARCPDPTARGPAGGTAGHLCVSGGEAAVGPGSAGVLRHVLPAPCGEGGEAVCTWPGSGACPLVVAVPAATSAHAPPTVSGGHGPDGIRTRVSVRAGAVVPCSPHHPTGAVADHGESRGSPRPLPGRVVTVLGEAHVESDRRGDPPGMPEAPHGHGGTVVLRTFSEAYEPAGPRVGRAAGPRRIAATARGTAMASGVTRFAERAAVLSSRDEGELRTHPTAAAAAREELTAGLGEPGSPGPPSRADFVRPPLVSAAGSFARAAVTAGHGVRGRPGRGVRISAGGAEAHRMLPAAPGRRTSEVGIL
ncbi:aminotransferase class I/II-fold pyridoxal phosphate-dependent enzyme [Streptomyces sp. MRC013]|uniref:aminotransferase class I/II-fold pyridoxal phosphate-dependent enzyme n=1 Tax=Streptomyces sp. MRC013 TaxID=2898276 RepID=UPI0032EA0A16